MVDKNYAIAMAEFLYFLKGFSDEEINKIPKELLDFFKENKDKNYICDFDYNKDLEDLTLKDETYGLISMVCYNYWCETPEEKNNYLSILNENEIKYQEELQKKYSPNNLYNDKEKYNNNAISEKDVSLVKINKETWYNKIISFFRRVFKK